MRIEEIYKNLASQKKKKNKYILYRYDIRTGNINSCMKTTRHNDIEEYVEEEHLTLIPYSTFVAEGKRLRQYLSKSRKVTLAFGKKGAINSTLEEI